MIRIFAILMLIAAPASAELVRLTIKDTARVAAGNAVTVADVAAIEGDPSVGRSIVIAADRASERTGADGWLEVTARDIAEATGIPRARLLVRGQACRVRLLRSAPAHNTPAHAEGRLPDAFDGPILRDHIRARIAAELGVDDADLRLDFAESDAEIIRTPTGGLTVEIQPLGLSAHMPIAATIYKGETIVFSETVRVDVLVRKPVLVAARPIERRSTIAPADFETERRWISPTLEPATAESAIDAVARGTLKPGETIEARHMEPPIVVERGDIVSVRCVSGSIVAKVAARALEDGRDGERIRFEPVNGGRRFHATVNGRGRAVLASSIPQEQP